MVGATSTLGLSAKETTPTLTSLGTLWRNCVTDARTVAIPDSLIDPLRSMRRIVDRSTDEADCAFAG